MKELFANMSNKREWINIDIGRLNADICYKDEYGDIFHGCRSLKVGKYFKMVLWMDN